MTELPEVGEGCASRKRDENLVGLVVCCHLKTKETGVMSSCLSSAAHPRSPVN
jgi:hypothetical protein